MKKRTIAMAMLAVMLINLCTGCGENTASDRREVSGSAVELEEGQNSVAKRNAEYQYANSTNLYIEKADDKKKEGFDQYTLDGKKKQSFTPKGFTSIFWVDDEGVYFDRDSKDSGYSEICCFRIHKGKDGTDELDTDTPEELIHYDSDLDVLFTSQYIVYYVDGYIHRFDKKTHEDKQVIKAERAETELEAVFGDSIALYDYEKEEDLIIVNLYPEAKQSKAQSLSTEYSFRKITAEDRYLIYWEDDEMDSIKKCKIYDSVTKEARTLISGEQLKKILLENEKATEKEWDTLMYEYSVPHTFYYNDRIYVECELAIPRGSVLEKKTAIISQSITKEEEPVYEKKMTETLRSMCDKMEGELIISYLSGIKRVITWNSGCFALVEGKMIFYLWTNKKGSKKPVGHYEEGMYDIQTGTFTRLSEKDAEYYYPFYVNDWDTLNCAAGFSNMSFAEKIVWK